MNRIFVISDLHLFHEEIHNFENRPRGYEKLILKRWNNVVKEEDTVYVLGDINFWKSEDLKPYMDKLNGKKILVKGNHDKKTIHYYGNNGFDFVCDEFRINNIFWYNIIFSHIPLKEIPDGYINIHWHLHSCKLRSDQIYTREKNYLLYNPEKTGFNLTPVLLKTFLKIKSI